MKHLLSPLLLGGAALVLTAGIAQADNLGTANDYNVFVLGNDTQYGTDAQGKIAVGGTADFTNGSGNGYAINTNHGGSTSNALIVMGNYLNNNNTVNGTIYVGGNATVGNPSVTGSLYVNGNTTTTGGGTIFGSMNLVTGKTYSHAQNYTPFSNPSFSSVPYAIPVDFVASGTYLKNHATGWGGLAANGTTSVSAHNITLDHGTGLSGSSPDIFYIDGDTLASNTGITINARSGATVLVNISKRADGSDAVPSAQITINGTSKQNVLYNFYNANTISFNSVSIQGSVLAPYASVFFNGGNIDGTMIAGALSGTGELHEFLFQGVLPGVTLSTTPEPGAFTLFGAALLSGAYAFRRRRRK